MFSLKVHLDLPQNLVLGLLNAIQPHSYKQVLNRRGFVQELVLLFDSEELLFKARQRLVQSNYKVESAQFE